MYQIDNSTAAAAQPASTAAGTAGFFTDGNPAGGVAATIVPAEWLNAVMMELINIVTAGGLTPSKSTFNQVLAAIKRLGQNTILLADTGAANAYTAANATPLVAGTWVDGVVQAVKIAHANTGPSTYAPDGLPAIPIYGLGLQPLQGGELALNGTAVLMRLTIPGVNSGNPICVLMECAGGAQQVAPATQSQHALQRQQTGIQAFTSNGSFTVPPGVSTLYYSGCAGGGGGGGGGGVLGVTSGTASAGGGGGGALGQYAQRVALSVTPGQVLTVSIGSGGAAGTAAPAGNVGGTGGTGGNTTVTGTGVSVTLTGGAGGGGGATPPGNNSGGSPGGAGTGAAQGDYGVAVSGYASNYGGKGGHGADGPFGTGGKGATNLAGTAAQGFGTGGGGGSGQNTSSSVVGLVGGAGAPGLMIFEW